MSRSVLCGASGSHPGSQQPLFGFRPFTVPQVLQKANKAEDVQEAEEEEEEEERSQVRSFILGPPFSFYWICWICITSVCHC